MSRRKRVYKKEEHVDSRYGSPAVERLITTVMNRGKKSLAERIVYTAIDKSREGSDSVDPLEVVNKAIENVRPRLEVKSRRVGGATYQVPMEVTPARQISLATAVDRSIRGQSQRSADGGCAGAGDKGRCSRARGTRSRNAKTHIKWRKRTARLRISVGEDYGDGDDGTEKGRGEKSKFAESQVPAGTNAEHRHRGAYRRRQDDDH